MASDSGREAKEALLKAIKDSAEAVSQKATGQTTACEALRNLAEAYALLERPIAGTGSR